jgi:hypothetical protein
MFIGIYFLYSTLLVWISSYYASFTFPYYLAFAFKQAPYRRY